MFQSTHPRGVRPQPISGIPPKGMFQSTHPRGVRRPQRQARGPAVPVSIHAPAWGATSANASRWPGTLCFNPRTRVGCDGKLGDFHEFDFLFQSTHPRGVRPNASMPNWPPARFQSTHPRGVRRQGVGAVFFNISVFQSTHPRGVRPRGHPQGHPRDRVSIHAPAWGATPPWSVSRTKFLFQSTHPRGVRRQHKTSCGAGRPRFNPRTRVGCDARPVAAPAWAWLRFNPRTRVGCDATTSSLSMRLALFQSTHPRGVRPPHATTAASSPSGFNPRTRVGCDASTSRRSRRLMWFQSTHPRGVRQWLQTPCPASAAVSIHAPAWGATS